jgi:hypothetical protein
MSVSGFPRGRGDEVGEHVEDGTDADAEECDCEAVAAGGYGSE